MRVSRDAAIVVGASMAGLCAARVLSEHFERVVVIERDSLPEGAEPRDLVPQGRHPHLLLAAGAQLLDTWFPTILEELRTNGAIDVDLSNDFYWYQSGGPQRRAPSMAHGPSMSRPLLERAVRRRVETLDNVAIRDRTAVEGLSTDPSNTRVTGVRLSEGDVLHSDLLIDASGRHARSLAWLAQLGYDPPPTSIIQIDTRYVSRIYQRDQCPDRDWKAAAVIGDPPTKRLAMILPIEGDRWILTIAGVNGESAPTDPDAYLAYARTLESPVVADLMASSQPLSDPVSHRFPANQRRHIERLRRFPLGWVLLGDAVCSFDPIYGQGMTSAAQQAAALGRQLERSDEIDSAFARAYFRATSKIVAVPWSIAVGGDFVYEATSGPKPFGTDVLNRYMDRVVKAGQHDDQVAVRVNEVVSLLRGPQTLLAPTFVLRVLRAARRCGTSNRPSRELTVAGERRDVKPSLDRPGLEGGLST